MNKKELGWYMVLVGFALMGVYLFLLFIDRFCCDLLPGPLAYPYLIMVFAGLILISIGVGKMKG